MRTRLPAKLGLLQPSGLQRRAALPCHSPVNPHFSPQSILAACKASRCPRTGSTSKPRIRLALIPARRTFRPPSTPRAPRPAPAACGCTPRQRAARWGRAHSAPTRRRRGERAARSVAGWGVLIAFSLAFLIPVVALQSLLQLPELLGSELAIRFRRVCQQLTTLLEDGE